MRMERPVNSPLTVTCWRRSLRLFKAANYNLRKRWGVGSCMANPTTWNRKGHWGLGRQPKTCVPLAPLRTISTPESRCIVRAIPTDADLMVARSTHSVALAKG